MLSSFGFEAAGAAERTRGPDAGSACRRRRIEDRRTASSRTSAPQAVRERRERPARAPCRRPARPGCRCRSRSWSGSPAWRSHLPAAPREPLAALRVRERPGRRRRPGQTPVRAPRPAPRRRGPAEPRARRVPRVPERHRRGAAGTSASASADAGAASVALSSTAGASDTSPAVSSSGFTGSGSGLGVEPASAAASVSGARSTAPWLSGASPFSGGLPCSEVTAAPQCCFRPGVLGARQTGHTVPQRRSWPLDRVEERCGSRRSARRERCLAKGRPQRA